MAEYTNSKRTLLRQKAEGLQKLGVAKSTDLLPTESDSLKLISELLVHQIEPILQYEQLTQAIQQEVLTKARYNLLFDFAPCAFFVLNSVGDIIESNLMGAKMLGKEVKNLFNSRLALFTTIDSIITFADFLSKIIIDNSPQSCEVAFSAVNGIPLHLQLSDTLSNDRSHCLITAVDITDRKNLEMLQGKEKDFELNSQLLRLFSIAPNLTDEELYSQAMDIAIKIADSKIGLYHRSGLNLVQGIP